MISPGIIAAKIHPTGSVQKCTMNPSLLGSVGRNVFDTGNRCWSSAFSSPICGMAMKMIIEIAAAYSVSPMRTYLWNSGFQEFAVLRKTATRKVPIHPITEYRNDASEVLACARSSSWTALWKYMMLFSSEKISVLNVVTYPIVQSCAFRTARTQCIHPAWIHAHAMNGRYGMLSVSLQRANILSDRIQKGPVTPRMVNGCDENLVYQDPSHGL